MLLNLLLSWRTKSIRSARFLFAVALYYNIHSLYLRGGFHHAPVVSFVGLTSPIASLIVSSSRMEPLIWLVLHVAGNGAILLMDVYGFLPAVSTSSMTSFVQNMVGLVVLHLFYLLLFRFIVHVYAAEMDVRYSLEKDLNVFMRLSHEIRTPITVISGVIQLMQDWALDVDKKCSVSHIATSARRLQAVVNDLLAFAGSTTEDLNEMVDFNIREIMRNH